jgi:hypothetical protein
VIFTDKHYSLVGDGAEKPRLSLSELTAEEFLSMWRSFSAHAGTYELTGATLVQHLMVAKEPEVQVSRTGVIRSTIKLDGNNLWLTRTEVPTGKIPYPWTMRLSRLE